LQQRVHSAVEVSRLKMDSVRDFYRGKTILITGGTGYMGKILVEKLLYSCSDVKEILVIVRPKKGQSIEERIKDFAKLPIFKRIVNEKREVLEKLTPIYGDVCEVNLGLSEADFQRVICETNIIFHLAATVRFDNPLKVAIHVNLRGTFNLMEVARQMKNLVVFIYTSTAFACCDQDVLQEEVYEWNGANPMGLLAAEEWMSEEAMNELSKILVKPHPNTYSFTKRLTEIMLRDEYPKLPVVIVRPSIVTSTWRDPVPGFVDNLNGAMGVMVGAGKGVICSMLCDGSLSAEVIPVDFATNGFIIIACKFATLKERLSINLRASKCVN